MNDMDYDQRYNKIDRENKKYLMIFRDDLTTAGLTNKTIEQHLFNMDCYLNDYLLNRNLSEMNEGCSEVINLFLGDFFIYKCMWSTPASIKSTAAGIKKFYKIMSEHEYITEDKYRNLCSIIKENIKEWQDECERFNNGEDMDDFFL